MINKADKMLKNEPVGYTTLILAAGHSARMGSPKALLLWNKDGYCFLEKIIDAYMAAEIKNIVVVVNEVLFKALKSDYPHILAKATFIINYQPDLGRLYSIQQGLAAVEPNQHVFIQNVDNPFISTEVIKAMLQVNLKDEYLQPCCKNQSSHPIILSKDIINSIHQNLDNYDDLKSILKLFERKYFKHDDEYLHVNINTKDDYEYWIKSRS